MQATRYIFIADKDPSNVLAIKETDAPLVEAIGLATCHNCYVSYEECSGNEV